MHVGVGPRKIIEGQAPEDREERCAPGHVHTRHGEGTQAASSKSSGGRLQEFLAEGVAQQSHDETRGQPSSRGTLGAGRDAVHPQRRLQPFGRQFDIP